MTYLQPQIRHEILDQFFLAIKNKKQLRFSASPDKTQGVRYSRSQQEGQVYLTISIPTGAAEERMCYGKQAICQIVFGFRGLVTFYIIAAL